MKYLKLFEKDEDAIYNRTSDTLYDAPGVAYIKDVDKVIYAPFDLNQKYYIDENYNAVLYRESYIDIVNNSETINISDISSPIVKTINFTFENITTDNIEIVLSGTSNVTSSEISLDDNSGSFDITYTPVNYGTESVQLYLKGYSSKNTEELVSSNIVTFNYIVEKELDYLTITMLDDGIFSIRDNFVPKESNEGIAPLDLKYSINKGEWQTYNINTEINLKSNDNIRLKGNNEYFSLSNKYGPVYARAFYIKGYYNVSGHLISLLSENLQYNKDLPSGCFIYMFQDYFKVLDFDSETIENNFDNIEWRKENLKGVVDASKLILPESLSTNIYAIMFYACPNLVKAPELKAMTLADNCYYNMFFMCNSLTIAPKLPAKILKEYCYSNMFVGCTSLTEAPELQATELVKGCYSNMFTGCTNLNYIKVSFTDWKDNYESSIDNPTYNWVSNVASEGTFKCPEELTLSTGSSYVPEGWVVPSKASISMANKDSLETPITVQTNTTQSFTINVDLQQLTLENCNVTSSNNKFTIGSKKNNSIVVNFKSTTSGTFTSTITISDNTYNTGKSDSVVLTVNVPEPKKSYYLRYGTLNNDNYNTWTNEVEGIEQTNGDIVFEPLNFTINNNFIALTTKENDTSLSTNINISNFTGSGDVSVQDMGDQFWEGKYEYRISVGVETNYSITFNLTNKTIYVKTVLPHQGGSND